MYNRLLFGILCTLLTLGANAQPNYPIDPQDAQLVINDLDNFLNAYQMLDQDSDTIAILKLHYFDKASDGLIEYISRHQLTDTVLAKAIYTYPSAYKTLAAFRKKVNRFEKAFKKQMESYDRTVGDVMYPPTFLLVGANKGIAQASPKGQLITLEKAASREEVLLQLITHELTHFQQARALGFQNYAKTYGKSNNMLELILREGGAEFVSYYLAGNKNLEYRNKAYFESNEQALKNRFLNDLKNQDQSYWLWESLNQNEVPTLLGYTMGYRICEAYYRKAVDKEQALMDILAIRNDKAFLEASGYFDSTD